VSSAITSEPIGQGEIASRLIPGLAVGRPTRGRAPQPVARDGKTASTAVPRAEPGARTFSVSRDLLLPKPVVAGNRWELCRALMTDYSLILASWSIGYCAIWLLRALQTGEFHGLGTGFLAAGTLRLALAFAVTATLLGYSEGLYQRGFGEFANFGTAILGKSVGWSAILIGAFAWASGPPVWNARLLMVCTGLSFASLFLIRRLEQQKRYIASSRSDLRNVLIVGAGAVGRQVAAYLARHPECGRVVRGFLDDRDVPMFGVLGTPQNLTEIAQAQFADEIILAIPHRGELAQNLVREARRHHLDVKAVPDLFGCEVLDPWIETLGSIPLITLHREELPLAGLFLKRGFDVVTSFVALLSTAPVLLLIAILIRLDSPGPVLYGAPRVGRKGRRFRCYKFRTMTANANDLKEKLRGQNQRQGPCFKIVNDPRITRVGRWLRRYSLDELPQLWNVLRGEMSLVGPRPHPLDDFARYELEHLRRLDVTPGITGLWQVMARQNVSFQTNLALDLEYIERWSLWMDLRILLKTFAVVVQGTGA
jgi:exopolysaccharide biosynthesis polyprenyl glycosylphosphotransferase